MITLTGKMPNMPYEGPFTIADKTGKLLSPLREQSGGKKHKKHHYTKKRYNTFRKYSNKSKKNKKHNKTQRRYKK
jgi:hypothetical protein